MSCCRFYGHPAKVVFWGPISGVALQRLRSSRARHIQAQFQPTARPPSISKQASTVRRDGPIAKSGNKLKRGGNQRARSTGDIAHCAEQAAFANIGNMVMVGEAHAEPTLKARLAGGHPRGLAVELEAKIAEPGPEHWAVRRTGPYPIPR